MLVDVLKSRQTPLRSSKMMDAVYRAAFAIGHDARLFKDGPPRADSWLVLYGLGGPDRVQYVKRPRLICFDMAYWERKGIDRKYRVSVNGFHCPELIFRGRDPGPGRLNQSGIKLQQAGDVNGPVVLVGNAPKSIAVGASGWTARKAREIREAFPGRRLVYRPKPGRPPESGVDYDALDDGPIDDLVARASLVVCRHSNVAVDACRLGVPVVCEDGAAASIYPRWLHDWEHQPSEQRRAEFMRRIAWWQWSPSEAHEFWHWIMGVVREVH